MFVDNALVSEMRATVAVAGPLAAANLAQTAMGFTNTVMVGSLGSGALAAAGLGENARRELEVDIGIARERKQAGGGIVGRPIRQLRPCAVIENNARLWETLRHADHLRNGFG